MGEQDLVAEAWQQGRVRMPRGVWIKLEERARASGQNVNAAFVDAVRGVDSLRSTVQAAVAEAAEPLGGLIRQEVAAAVQAAWRQQPLRQAAPQPPAIPPALLAIAQRLQLSPAVVVDVAALLLSELQASDLQALGDTADRLDVNPGKLVWALARAEPSDCRLFLKGAENKARAEAAA
jgi:hypothetical protein